jgi:hypothetical protein
MRKGTTLFIAAYNARSISYAQTLKHRQVRISKTLILKPSGQSLPKSLFEHLHSHRIYSNILLPDFSVPLHDTCSEISDRVEEIDCSNINSDIVFDKLKTEIQDAQLVVYSGFGGQRQIHFGGGGLEKLLGSVCGGQGSGNFRSAEKMKRRSYIC